MKTNLVGNTSPCFMGEKKLSRRQQDRMIRQNHQATLLEYNKVWKDKTSPHYMNLNQAAAIQKRIPSELQAAFTRVYDKDFNARGRLSLNEFSVSARRLLGRIFG